MMEAIVFFFSTAWWLLCGQLFKGSLRDCIIIIGVWLRQNIAAALSCCTKEAARKKNE